MKLADLERPAWAAALHSARFRVSRQRLVALLPIDVDASDIIAQAVHWYALSDVAAQFAGFAEAAA